MTRCVSCGTPVKRNAKRCATCRGLHLLQRPKTKRQARDRARTLVKTMVKCKACGARDGLQRHHPDIDARPDWIVVLCVPCHIQADKRLHKRGGGARSYELPLGPAMAPIAGGDIARRVVYLIGMPGSGKSAIVTRCKDLYATLMSNWAHLSADDLRATHGDNLAAEIGRLLFAAAGPTVLESSGLNAAAEHAVMAANASGRHLQVVMCCAAPDTMERRVRERDKAPLWGDVDQLIRWMHGARLRLEARWPTDRCCRLQTYGSLDDSAGRFVDLIL
jgi:hypothetical protein